MWLIPSLSRPHLLANFFKSYKETFASTPGMVLVDKTDPRKDEYFKLNYPPNWKLVLTESITMGDKVREVWPQIITEHWVGILNDDHYAITHHWDKKVTSHITGTNVVATNDNWVAPNRLAGAICFSGEVLRTLGYMFLPGMHHLFSDDVWMYLFGRSGAAQIVMDVVVEHRHAYKDPSLVDSTFIKINGPKGLVNGKGEGGFWPNDEKIFKDWMSSGQADQDVQKIIDLQPKQGLMLAVPVQHGDCALDWALGLADLSTFLTRSNIYFEMARIVGSSLLPHARNSLADIFLKSRCQKLVFIDADQGFTKEGVLHLFQSDKKIAAGVVPHKRFPLNLNFEPLDEDKPYFNNLVNKSAEEFWRFAKEKASPQGEIRVKRSGTGMICIDRSVFDLMIPQVNEYYPFDNNQDFTHKEFFKFGIDQENKRYMGEDWHFTALAEKLGIPMYINANSICTHKGQFMFTLDRPAI